MKLFNRRFWIKEARLWTADCVKLANLNDWPVVNASPLFPPTEAGVYAKCAATAYFKAYPEAREVPSHAK